MKKIYLLSFFLFLFFISGCNSNNTDFNIFKEHGMYNKAEYSTVHNYVNLTYFKTKESFFEHISSNHNLLAFYEKNISRCKNVRFPDACSSVITKSKKCNSNFCNIIVNGKSDLCSNKDYNNYTSCLRHMYFFKAFYYENDKYCDLLPLIENKYLCKNMFKFNTSN